MTCLLYLYWDSAREQVDYEVDPPPGAMGSNWQVGGEYPDFQSAAKAGEEFVAAAPDSFGRGHWTNPTF